jgi:hypothetical protein
LPARPEFGSADLDCEVVFDRYLGADDELDVLQALLVAAAPRWCSKLRVWRGPRDQRLVDVGRPGALRAAVLAAAGERGPTYRALVERYGAGDERLVGSAELRGAGPELVLVVSVDERVVSPLGPATQLGNDIALQVRRPRVKGRGGAVWVQEVFTGLCAGLSPAWGSAQHPAEYWAKVMSDGPSIAAVGRDFGRFLPGVFWLNFFGRRYRALLGEERLRSTPADAVLAVDDGVLVALAPGPWNWDTPEYAVAEQRVRDHLGAELFFSKAHPDRPTVAPDWDR